MAIGVRTAIRDRSDTAPASSDCREAFGNRDCCASNSRYRIYDVDYPTDNNASFLAFAAVPGTRQTWIGGSDRCETSVGTPDPVTNTVLVTICAGTRRGFFESPPSHRDTRGREAAVAGATGPPRQRPRWRRGPRRPAHRQGRRRSCASTPNHGAVANPAPASVCGNGSTSAPSTSVFQSSFPVLAVLCTIRAANPATCGVAMDVPLIVL